MPSRFCSGSRPAQSRVRPPLMPSPRRPMCPPDSPRRSSSADLNVRQAEMQLVAANAEVGVKTAALFPTFPLTGEAGLLSANLGPLLSEMGWSYLLLGTANWTAPILQGSALRAQLEAANASKSAALVTYEQTAFAAFREVADALVSLERLREQRAHQERQVASLDRAVDVSATQFRGGTATYLDVVTAEENAFAAELSLAQLEGQQLVEFVQLYRALGGGWWVAMK